MYTRASLLGTLDTLGAPTRLIDSRKRWQFHQQKKKKLLPLLYMSGLSALHTYDIVMGILTFL